LEHPTNGRILLVFLEKAVPDVAKVLEFLGPLRDDMEAIGITSDEDTLERRAVLPLQGNGKARRKVLDVFRIRRRHFEYGNMDWYDELLALVAQSLFRGPKSSIFSM